MSDLSEIGRRRQRAKAALDRVTKEAKRAAVEAAERGVPETELARALGVDRMTIRSWLGKR